jgi:hypothetical protein
VTTAGLTSVVSLLALLGLTVGLSGLAWLTGLALGLVLSASVGHGLRTARLFGVGQADLITLTRGVLACGLGALAVDALLGRGPTPAVLALAVPALVSDAVDGWVARRGTATAFGGRLDGEADAFLILVLSVGAVPSVGWWVLSAGLVRYVFWLAVQGLPWMRRELPFRYWRKVVTATVSIVLTAVAADLLSPTWTVGAAAAALLMLAESFGRDVLWLWHRRERRQGRGHPHWRGRRQGRGRAGRSRPATEHRPPAGRRRPGWSVVGDVVAVVVVWVALLLPAEPTRLGPLAFVRLPVEALVLVALALVLPSRWARRTALLLGAVLAVLTLLKVLDLGAFAVLDRPFDPVTDHGLLASGLGFVRDSWGPVVAVGAVVGVVVVAAAVLVGTPLAVGRLTRVVTSHPAAGRPVVAVLAVGWLAGAVLGLRVTPGETLAAADASRFGVDTVRTTVTTLRTQQRFDQEVAADPLRDPARADLSGLRGKDVLVVFVESYGRVALQGPESEQIRTLLDERTARLAAAGYTARSAYLTSPTFGGSSWLAHATLMSGVWSDSQWRHDRLVSGSRTTLTGVFARAGWDTVAVVPSNHGPWPEGRSFYRFDRVHDRSGLGYAGPRFGFSAMPDQYTLAAFERLELATPDRPPLMAEIDLTSSHGPWAPLPTRVDPARLGDGSVFDEVEADAVTAKELWSDRAKVPAAYRTSIEYSLDSLLTFVQTSGDDNLVVVFLGDHQPSTIVTGSGAARDVPVTVLAHDPKVIDQLQGWGWQDGLRPDDTAPVWRMDAFRDRFVSAFSSSSSPTAGAPR